MLEKLKNKSKIVITGMPRTGKTILSKKLAKILKIPVLHTDDLLHLPYSEIPGAIIAASESIPSYIIEGCQGARALVRGLEADVVIVMTEPYAKLTPRQEAFGKQMIKCIQAYDGDTIYPDEDKSLG